jgi:hypothetical protein
MRHLINKDAVVAEIERLENDEFLCDSYDVATGFQSALRMVQEFISTLDVKEVDNIWHDANETPKGAGDKEILVQFADSHASVLEIDDWEYLDHQTKWAYLKDLM